MFRVLAFWFSSFLAAIAAPALAQVTYGPLVDFSMPDVITDAENPVVVVVRDMRIGVTAFVLCPEPEPLLQAMLGIGTGDVEAISAAIAGQGCFLANDGWGPISAVHIYSLARVRWTWLAGIDIDSNTPERLENSGREYWALSTQLGTMGANDPIESLIRAAFR